MGGEYGLPAVGGHRLELEGRERLVVTGVEDVAEFDDGTRILRTVLGPLILQGQDLKLKSLSPEGTVTVEGTLSALQYGEVRERRSWLRGLLG